MKANVIILAGIISVTALFSCNKSDDIVTTPTAANKVKAYIEDITTGLFHTADTFSLTYDGSNRIVSAISLSGNKLLYTYNGNTDFNLDIMNGTIINTRAKTYINSANLLMDSTYQFNNSGDTSTQKFIYNSANQLIEERNYDYSALTGPQYVGKDVYAYDANGNMISDIETDDLGATLQVTTYTYGSAVANIFTGMIYQAQGSKNLPVSITYTPTGGIPQTETITYTFDSDNRVTSETHTSTGTIVIKSYTYY